MTIVGIIPARYDSSRLPGKPLLDIGGRPMIQWVYEAARSCSALSHVAVATDSERVADCVHSFEGVVEMTRGDHQTGTDRIAEAAMRYPEAAVVVNVQGDQPFVTPEMLTSLIAPYLEGEKPPMTTLACPLVDPEHYRDPNFVKVVCSRAGDALYFSRAPIPHVQGRAEAGLVYHHLGLYAFTRSFLMTYGQLERTPLEHAEGLEQLRALEHGFRIHVCRTHAPVVEINTQEDLARARAALAESGSR